MSEIRRIWKDQSNFNEQLRGTPPIDFHERSKLSKEIALNQYSEIDEMLRTLNWKSHRRQPINPNPAHTLEELVDQFKLWMTQCQIHGYTMEEVFDAYWRKSAVVRHRYTTEWIKHLDGKCVIIDIDNVIADYITGYCRWLQRHYPALSDRCERLIADRGWINAASLELDERVHQEIKHEFRVTGGKRHLPVFEGAKEFLLQCQAHWSVVLLTSRPIDRYPNMFTDTIEWLNKNEIPYDFLWWSVDKAERVLEEQVRKNVVFVVDDDLRHITAFASMRIPSYWMNWSAKTPLDRETQWRSINLFPDRERITVISDFDQIPFGQFFPQETTHA